ncbi:MAG TPA: DUF3570 domain-containing protein [Polyangiaceae bacterium]|nr:DUF3570 domain-containing protein [Polyangiaceae bacterium]
MLHRNAFWRTAFALAIAIVPKIAGAETRFSDAEVLGTPPAPFRIVSVKTRTTAIVQTGRGYQSIAGAVSGQPGSQNLTVLQPQIEVVAKQGERLTHTVWAPVDIVTSASATAIDRRRTPVDVISTASAINESAALDWTTDYKVDADTNVFVRAGLHLEEPYRSWTFGLGGSKSFAGGNTAVSASAIQMLDWLDRFQITGTRIGRASRTSSNVNLSLVQILSPVTVAHLSYGLTIQEGELGNTWNRVPLLTGNWDSELLPSQRVRHALVGRVAQWLPWNGALKGYYRFYHDDWGIDAHTAELQLHQRIGRALTFRGSYRHHRQSGASFFTIHGLAEARLRTADSDLDLLSSNAVGGHLSLRYPWPAWREVEFEVGYERYFRSNDLEANVVTCSVGFQF